MEKVISLKEIIDSINSLKEKIKTQYKAEVVGIFGSFVRGEEKKSSDIDILVEFNEDADLFDFVGLSIFLEEKLGRKVDVVPRDMVRPELKKRILKETVSV
ncbi:nucleotidyltransferase [Dissulfurispira thermophila]|uniref:Nucleotidyltransferase n=2 Tax=root TaxID=1 RepID=A0A7G1H1Q3_9BACT|nr:nucleotidyltransferase family protein [Dissulfurispira thermophila]BCB96735.1 nucleotidyltransferase [Dissulfurispira thermophila]